MKLNITVFLLAGVLIACQPKGKEVSNREDTGQISGFYGEKINAENAVSVNEMQAELLSEGSFEGKVRGEIKEVCTNKGCWMTISLPDGELMRVTFKDYGFFVLTDSQGYPVILEGKATKSVTDVAALRHFAEDAGKSEKEIEAIQADEESFTFEATGVIISNSI